MVCGAVAYVSVLLLINCHSSESQHLEDNSSTEIYYDYDGMEKEFGKKTDFQTTTLRSIEDSSYEMEESAKIEVHSAIRTDGKQNEKGVRANRGDGVRESKPISSEEEKNDESFNEDEERERNNASTTTFEPSTVSEGSDEDSKTTILFSGFYTAAEDGGSKEQTTTVFLTEDEGSREETTTILTTQDESSKEETTSVLPTEEATTTVETTTPAQTTTTFQPTTTTPKTETSTIVTTTTVKTPQPDSPSYHELEQERHLSKKHRCSRECIEGADPMVCSYHFKVEWYHSMSKACYDCPFNITDCYRPDCVPTDGVKRPILVINRSMPGPAVEVCLGDTVVVDVENTLMEESTSIHWHGHHQRGSPYMDGVPFVTQCPIPPKTTFRYKYTASTSGTHFWHSHSGCQRADGAFGAFVVRKPLSQEFHQSLYDLDLPEHTVVTLDWSHQLGIALFAAHHHADGDNKPKTIQVNGKGMYRSFSDNGRDIYTPPASFTVTKGFRYRFRLINAGVLNCPISLSIDNHTLTVISSDGSDIKAVEVDSLVSYAGERWDFVLHAEKEIANYWMRFRGLMDCDERFTSAHQVAVLRYQGSNVNQRPAGAVNYKSAIRKGLVLNELNAPLNDSSLSIPELTAIDIDSDPTLKLLPDRKIILSYDFHPIDNPYYHKPQLYGFSQVPRNAERVYTPQLNHISLKLPPFPLLSQPFDLKPDMLCSKHNTKRCNESYCECTNIIEVKLGEVVEIILVDIGMTYDANHPFHLHGHPFRVVAMDRIGKNVTVEKILELDATGSIHRNLLTPPIKDTVTVPDGGYTIIRFQANNPGFWLFHCHIEFHVELGMALLFKVGTESDFPPVPRGFPTCGDFTPPQDPPNPVHENEIDFGDGLWVYNVSKDHGRKEHNIISVVHWWPLISNFRQRNSAPASKNCMYLNLILFFILWLKQFYKVS